MPVQRAGPQANFSSFCPKHALHWLKPRRCDHIRSRLLTVNAVAQRAAMTAAAATAPLPALVKIPTSLSEIDNGKILGFGADLAADHPGFADEPYKLRRVSISSLARDHQVGDPIPRVQYQPKEIATWGTVLRELTQLYPRHACREYRRNFPMFNFQEAEVPQLEDMSHILREATGWQIRPVAGLLHPRDFLNGLAFRTFHSTQYVRHHSKPMYTPEPDVCHELLGKAQLLDFDPFSPQPKMSYKDGYQKQYFVLNSFEDGAKQLLDYCLSITDPAVVKQHLKNLDVPL